MKSLSNVISIALIGGGVAAFVVSSRPLLGNSEADVPLNPLGINRSPYGEVIAMAMQGPIDTFFHATDAKGHQCSDPENCQHGHPEKDETAVASADRSWNDRLRHFIEELGAGQVERTNSRAASTGHKFYLRREVEDKLRFAYHLDPSHYGNYNAYHFFLTQPQLGTRPELTPGAAKLAEETIQYCLSQRTDPRQALTAAAAAGNVIELMFEDRLLHPDSPKYSPAQMREMLTIMDYSIGLYSHLSKEWTDKDLWKYLSELRQLEAKERLYFVLKIRDSHDQSIRRLEGLPQTERADTTAPAN